MDERSELGPSDRPASLLPFDSPGTSDSLGMERFPAPLSPTFDAQSILKSPVQPQTSISSSGSLGKYNKFKGTGRKILHDLRFVKIAFLLGILFLAALKLSTLAVGSIQCRTLTTSELESSKCLCLVV